MHSWKRVLQAGFALIAVAILILDAKTALLAAQEAVTLCIQTVIPSLFPLLLLCPMLTDGLRDLRLPFLRPLSTGLGIPNGEEALLLVGVLGGYPVGAQCVSQGWRAGAYSRETAQRLLGFCSNAGPAFLFGMIGPFFQSLAPVWALWGIHILGAGVVGLLLPKTKGEETLARKIETGSGHMKKALAVTGLICGWVILFRILILFCRRWFLWLFPTSVQVLFSGILELTNGCLALDAISLPGLRFVLCAGFLGFGGLCVGMQTSAVTEGLGMGMYIPGKLFQGFFSLFLSVFVQKLLFPPQQQVLLGSGTLWILIAGVISTGFMLRIGKKGIAFRRTIVYNRRKIPR